MKKLLGIYEKAFPDTLSIEEVLSISKKSNYDFFELNIDKSEKRINRIYNAEFINEIKRITKVLKFPIYHIGLSALSTYTLGNSDIRIRSRGLDILKNTIFFAKSIGCKLIQIPACDMPKGYIHSKQSNSVYIENLSKGVELASKEGIFLCLENMEDEYSDTIEKCLKIIDEINSPYLKLYPDSGNLTNAFNNNFEKIEKDVNKAKEHILAFHLKEVRKDKYGGLFYGEGIVDFNNIVKLALRNGVERFVMEYWYTGNEKWEKDIIDANVMARSWIEEKEC